MRKAFSSLQYTTLGRNRLVQSSIVTRSILASNLCISPLAEVRMSRLIQFSSYSKSSPRLIVRLQLDYIQLYLFSHLLSTYRRFYITYLRFSPMDHIYLINFSLLKEIKLELLQALWLEKEPAYEGLHIFRCEAYAFIPRENKTKLSPHATKCIFLGYGTDGEFGYKLWNPENRKLIRGSDVVFRLYSLTKPADNSGQNISFEIATNGVEGPSHRTECSEENEVQVLQGWGVKPTMASLPSQGGYDRESQRERQNGNDTKLERRNVYLHYVPHKGFLQYKM